MYFLTQFEADRRAFIITINSFGTELTKEDRFKLYPRCGQLNPDGLAALATCDDYDQVRNVADNYAVSNSGEFENKIGGWLTEVEQKLIRYLETSMCFSL